MGMQFDAPETTSDGGGFLNAVGQYHVVVNDVLEGESSKGKPIDGITITVEVLAGTTEGQNGKVKQESLFLPSAKDIEKEQAEEHPCMARKKLGALLIATNVMQPEQLGKPISFEPKEMIGSQCVIAFSKQKEMDGDGKYTIESKNLQISYSDIFHVDDPAVKAVPKNADALSLIDKAKRHPEQWFAWKKKRAAAPVNRQTVVAVNGKKDADDLF